MNAVIALALHILIATPLTALITTATASKIWEMLLKKQYGVGPTYASWYGIMAITTLLLMGIRIALSAVVKKDEGKAPIMDVVVSNVLIWILCGATLIMLAIVGGITGWTS
jgi:hypothetical protein